MIGLASKKSIGFFESGAFHDSLKLVIAFICAPPMLYLSTVLINMLYFSVLSPILPTAFPSYNAVLSPVLYNKLIGTLTLISVYTAIFAMSWLVTVYNERKENELYLETYGFYELAYGYKLYFKKYFISDIISAVLVNIIFGALSYFLTTSFEKYIDKLADKLFALYGSVFSLLDPTIAILLGVLSAMLARIPVAFFAVRRWRGKMLAHDIEF